jgi:hypothetical protein
VAFSSYSTNPDSNTSINGINIAENCPAANTNNALRQIAADGRELHDTVTAISVSSYMPLAGGAFTGTIYRGGAGGYLYHVPSGLSGPVYILQQGTALPSGPAEGTLVFFWQ